MAVTIRIFLRGEHEQSLKEIEDDIKRLKRNIWAINDDLKTLGWQ